MAHSFPVCFSPGISGRIGASLATAALAVGCTSARSRVDAEAAIARSLQSAEAIVFRTEGDPLDAGGGSTGSLTAADAVRRAIETSPELQVALARVRVAEAEADQAALLPNPVLSFVLRFPSGGGKPDIDAGLSADLLSVLQRPRRTSAAEQRIEAEAARALSTALDVVADVQARYAEVQALEELVPVLEGRLELLGRLRDVAQARLDIGEGTRQDVTALEAERTLLAVDIAAQRQELNLARLGLARALGDPSGPAAWTLEPWSPPAAIQVAEQSWIEAALESRPEVLAIEWELAAREDEEALARGEVFGGAAVGVAAERQPDWSVGPSIASPLPLFDTGSARAARARALTSEERHRLTQAQRTVVEEVRSALATLISSQQSYERVLRDLMPLQERRRSEIEEAYRLGLVDVTSLLLADQALQAARARRVELARDVSLAQNRLQRTVGGPSSFRSTAALTSGSPRP